MILRVDEWKSNRDRILSLKDTNGSLSLIYRQVYHGPIF
jgi:hypothetical protein